MASQLLFDIDGIDLNAVAVDADRVGEINPQCGAMRQLDHVIWVSEDCTRSLGVKHVTDQEFWVPLHIPGRPLMPGVLIIEAAAQLCSVQFHYRLTSTEFLGFTRCDDTAFRGQVLPGDTLLLLAVEVQCRPRRFVARTQGLVNDKLVFESTITGMAF